MSAHAGKLKKNPTNLCQVKRCLADSEQDFLSDFSCTYLKGAHGVLVVFDLTNAASLPTALRLLDEVSPHLKADVIKMLIGNGSDKLGRAVSTEEASSRRCNICNQMLNRSKMTLSVLSTLFGERLVHHDM